MKIKCTIFLIILLSVTPLTLCLAQGDSWEELIKNIYEAVEACLSVDVEKIKINPSDKILDVAI